MKPQFLQPTGLYTNKTCCPHIQLKIAIERDVTLMSVLQFIGQKLMRIERENLDKLIA